MALDEGIAGLVSRLITPYSTVNKICWNSRVQSARQIVYEEVVIGLIACKYAVLDCRVLAQSVCRVPARLVENRSRGLLIGTVS